MPNTKEYSHLQRWTMPSCYFGEVWPDYFSAGVGQSRDSDALERANFQAMLERLGGKTSDDETGDPLVKVVRESHWAVGWVEWIAIHESQDRALGIANTIQAKLEDYPVIDEELWSQFEDEDCSETWANCFDPSERLDYFRRHSFTSNGIGALLRAIRGDWYEAANMLHCPSDLIA